MFGRRPLLAISAIPVAALLAACGGETEPVSEAAAAASTQSASEVAPPASQYAPSADEVGPGYSVDQPNTYTLTEENYGRARTFVSPSQGKAMLRAWGYVGGYETSYVPQGLEAAIPAGAYYVTVECHLFATEAGAQEAYTYFESRLKSVAGTERVDLAPVGDAASAWRTAQGKVRATSLDAAYHRVLFRRKNMVVVVQTYGAAQKMTVDHAQAIAEAIESKSEAAAAQAKPGY